MNDLISRKYLYDKMSEKEELARQRVLDTPTHSPAYLRYVAQLNERTALKHEIADAPDVTDTNVGSKWISCSERLPESSEPCLCWVKSKTISSGETFIIGSCERERFWFLQTYEIGHHHFPVKDYEVVAWMPLPEPYKGE